MLGQQFLNANGNRYGPGALGAQSHKMQRESHRAQRRPLKGVPEKKTPHDLENRKKQVKHCSLAICEDSELFQDEGDCAHVKALEEKILG